MLIGTILQRSADRFAHRPAVIAGDRQLTYRELDAAADRIAAVLVGSGLKAGDRITILSANIVEVPLLYFAAARAGLIQAHISVRAAPAEIVAILDQTEAAALFFQPELAPLVDQVAALGNLPRLLVSLGDATDRAMSFETFLSQSDTAALPTDLAPDTPYCMTYTGGTTGRPKGVLASHRARSLSAITAALEFGISERDVTLVATPLFHVAGLYVWFTPNILAGASCVLLEKWDAGACLAALAQHPITSTMLVPTQLLDLMSHPEFVPDKLAGIERIVYAGAPMPPALFDRARTEMPWIEFIENYGQSEIACVTVRRGWHLPSKLGSIGRPMVTAEVEVHDEDGNRLPPGEVGELATRGDHLLCEYYRNPEETSRLFRHDNGWMYTGDLARADEDGYLYLVDRARDLIIIGGENVFPTEVENALYQHPSVAECAVIGIPHDRLGEVPAAHVVLRDGETATEDDLVDTCLAQLARHKRPRLVKFVPSLPKTAIGKIQKNLIRAPYWEGRE